MHVQLKQTVKLMNRTAKKDLTGWPPIILQLMLVAISSVPCLGAQAHEEDKATDMIAV